MAGLEYAQTLAAGLLAALLAFSGGQKLISPFPAALAIVRFRLARRVRPLYGRLAGMVEVAVAFALALAPTEWWSVAAATGLTGFFVVIVARALARGADFPCACFGGHGGRISAVTLLRAAGMFLLAAAGLVTAAVTSSSVSFATGLLGVAIGVEVACIVAASLVLRRARPFSARPRAAEAA
jgi:hypothetical protein